jgi:hypothetical protein
MKKLEINDSFDMADAVENRGDSAMVELMRVKFPNIVDGMQRTLKRSIFSDGSQDNELTGLEAVLARDTNYAVVDSTDKVAIPGTTYFGLPTGPSQKGGTWSSGNKANAAFGYDWPDGEGDEQFDFYSPKLYHATTQVYGNSPYAFTDNCLDILTDAFNRIRLTGGVEASPKLGVFGSDYELAVKKKLRSVFRELMPHQPSRDMGFPGAITYEGAVIDGDFYCPMSKAYLVNPNAMELICVKQPPEGYEDVMDGGMMWGFGPVRDPIGTGHYMAVFFFGDLYCNPKNLAKIADFSP